MRLQQLRLTGCSSLWCASIWSARWSVVLKESAAGLPRWKYELRGGRANGQRNIQYSPEKGMLNGCIFARLNSPLPNWGIGAINVGIGFTSGQRITPGKPPSGKAVGGSLGTAYSVLWSGVRAPSGAPGFEGAGAELGSAPGGAGCSP